MICKSYPRKKHDMDFDVLSLSPFMNRLSLKTLIKPDTQVIRPPMKHMITLVIITINVSNYSVSALIQNNDQYTICMVRLPRISEKHVPIGFRMSSTYNRKPKALNEESLNTLVHDVGTVLEDPPHDKISVTLLFM